jgi:hypothetical protein
MNEEQGRQVPKSETGVAVPTSSMEPVPPTTSIERVPTTTSITDPDPLIQEEPDARADLAPAPEPWSAQPPEVRPADARLPEARPTDARPVRRGVRVRTVVFGLVMVALAVLSLVAMLTDVRLDGSVVGLVLLVGAGAALVGGGIASAVREARGGPGSGR